MDGYTLENIPIPISKPMNIVAIIYVALVIVGLIILFYPAKDGGN